jgi:hypothetical protein
MQKLGDLNAEEQLHIRALDDCERVLGPEHQRSIGTLHNFASFLASKGDRERAIAKYRLALERAEECLGEDHPSTKRFKKKLEEFLRSSDETDDQTDAFEGRRMLIAYYFIWHTGDPAPEQCEGCTWVTSQVRELSYIQ